MTARPLSAGSARTMALRCKARWKTAIEKLSGERVTVTGAGRTDAGRACAGPGGAFRPGKGIRARQDARWAQSLSAARSGGGAGSGDARMRIFTPAFPPSARHYLFRILNRRSPPALDAGRVWHVSARLDADAMHAAAQALVGQHDFTTFRAAECQAQSPVKTLDRLDVSRRGDEIHIEASARSFLHHQIRSFAGTLEAGGRRQMDAARCRGGAGAQKIAPAAARSRRRMGCIW